MHFFFLQIILFYSDLVISIVLSSSSLILFFVLTFPLFFASIELFILVTIFFSCNIFTWLLVISCIYLLTLYLSGETFYVYTCFKGIHHCLLKQGFLMVALTNSLSNNSKISVPSVLSSVHFFFHGVRDLSVSWHNKWLSVAFGYFQYYVTQLWILFKLSLSVGFLWCQSDRGSRGTASLLPSKGRNPVSTFNPLWSLVGRAPSNVGWV